MFSGSVFYNSAVRKAIISFGRLFSDIKINRVSPSNSDISKVIQIPLSYAPKEKWLRRLEEQPSLEKPLAITLPRMSFEILSMSYDSKRKLGRIQKLTKYDTENSTLTTQYTPVPYNLNINLYVVSSKLEDGLQIVEQILPYFSPEYSVTSNMIPEIDAAVDIPIILNSVSMEDNYDGSFLERRAIIYTLGFTVQIQLFGPVSNNGSIKTVITTIGDTDSEETQATYTAEVVPEESGPDDDYEIEESWEEEFN